MKKILLFIIGILLLSGCTLKSADRLIEATNNMDTLDNFLMNMDFSFKVTANQSVNIDINSIENVDNINNTSHYNMTTNFLGQSVTSEYYTAMSNDSIITYYNDNGWSKKVEDNSDDFIGDLFNSISDGTTIEKLEIEDDLTHFQITIDKETTKKLFLEAKVITGENIIEEDSAVNSLIIDVYVNKDNYINRMTVDFADSLNFIKIDSEQLVLNKMSFDFKFSKFNESGSVIIPDSVINSIN